MVWAGDREKRRMQLEGGRKGVREGLDMGRVVKAGYG